MGAESKLVAEVIVESGQAIAATEATKDAMVTALVETANANERVAASEANVTRAMGARVSVSKQVELAVRQAAAAGKPLETELVQLATRYAQLEAAMRSAAKSGGGVPAALAQEAAAVKARMGAVEGQIAKTAQSGATSLQMLGTSALGTLGAMTALGAGMMVVSSATRHLQDFLVDAVREAAEAEAVTIRLNRALESQGRYSKEASDAILERSKALSRETAFSDEQITSIQTQLVMLGKLSDQALPDATLAVMDLVAAGESQESAVDALSKAYNNNFKSLGQMLPAIRDAVKGAKSFEEVLALVNEQVGGQAAAELEGYPAKVKAFENAFSDLKEEVGMSLLPVLKDAVDGFREMTYAATDLYNFVADHQGVFSALSLTVSGIDFPGLVASYKEFKAELDKDPNTQLLEEATKAWEDAEAQLKKMQSSSAAGALENLDAIEKQKAKVDELYDSYTRLFQKQMDKGIGPFKGDNKTPTVDGGGGGDEAAEKAAAKEAAARKRAIEEALARVKRAHDEATQSATAYADSLIELAKAEDADALKVVELRQRNEELRLQVIEQIRAGQDNYQAKLDEIAANEVLIQQTEDEADARERATKAAEAQAKRIADKEIEESKRSADARAEIYLRLGESIAATMGTALVEVASGEKRGGQIAKGIARETALAVIRAAASEAAAKQIAAHAGIPFVGVAIGLAAAAAVVQAIFAQQKFMAMAGGGEFRGGVAGKDSIPTMVMPGELEVDTSTTKRLKRMLDAFETGGLQTSARGGTLQLVIQAPATVISSDAQIVSQVRKAMVPALEELRDTGHLDRLLGKVVR